MFFCWKWRFGKASHNEIPKELESVTSAQLQNADLQERIKSLSRYTVCRLAHSVFCVVAVFTFHWDSTVLFCSMIGTALYLFGLCLAWRCADSSSPRWPRCVSAFGVVAIVTVIDAGLIALTRYDVRCKFKFAIMPEIPGQGQYIHCPADPKLVHALSYQTTQVFQFFVLFFIVFVLKDSHTLPVGGLCVLFYSAVSLTATTPEDDFPHMILDHTDLILLGIVSTFSVIAKSKMAKSKGMLIDVLEKQSSHVVHEKVLRCKAEFTCEQLASRAIANQPVNTTSGGQDVAVRTNPDNRLATLSEVPLVSEDDAGTQVSSYPETATYSGPIFKEIAKTASQSNLTRLSRLGISEFWHISSNDLKVDSAKVLGSGGFGIVYAASYLGTPAAVKVSRILANRPDRLNDIVNELRILRRIRHPNIVLFFGACIDPLLLDLTLVLEKVHGERLDQFCAKAKRASVTNCWHIVISICHAICYIHGQSPVIVHGDLKPANIMVHSEVSSVRPRVKLLDFGLARLLTKSVESLGGTVAWMAPEVLSGHCSMPKPSVDVFAFARISYLVLVGQSPVDNVPRDMLKRMALRGMAPPLEWPEQNQINEFQTVLNRCVLFQADARPTIFEVHAVASSTKTLITAPDVEVLGVERQARDGVKFDMVAHRAGDVDLTRVKPTSNYAKFHTIATALMHWNADLSRANCCCPWHAAIHELELCINHYKQDYCWDSFAPFAQWQCKDCGALQESPCCRICDASTTKTAVRVSL